MIVSNEKCYFCNQINEFSISDGAVLMREACCCQCGASIRNNDVIHAILDRFCTNEMGIYGGGDA